MNMEFKRNYPILLLLVTVITVLALGLGNLRVIAYTTQAEISPTPASIAGYDISNDIALFDESLVHSIQVLMAEADYDEMISTYQNAGLKEYFKADVVIDGVRVYEVGIRLKGNASLRTALGGGMGMGEERPQNGQWPERSANGEMPEMPADGQRPERPINGEMPQMPGAGSSQENAGATEAGENPAALRFPAQGFGPGQAGQAASGETKIPFLIKFDEYVSGQTYQGHSFLSVRNYGTSFDAAMLQEPLTNAAARLAGIPTTQTAYSGFAINDADETLYVISEILDESYLEKYFENANGVLYKSEVGSTLSYVDENPSSYAKSFSQETRENEADLAPLIAFMRFLDQSDDATFESELPEWLDVDAFASYLALNALLVNTDSMLGMNNNYYLYYDDLEQRFTLLMWDANESLGKLGGSAAYDLSLTNTGGGPGGAPQGDRGGMGGGPGGGENALLTRFLANAKFKALYEQKVKEIYEQVFVSGAMVSDLERYAALVRSVNEQRGLVKIQAYEQAVQKTLTFIEQRMEYLAGRASQAPSQ